MDKIKQTNFFQLVLDLQRLAQFKADDDFYQRNTIKMLDLENQSDAQLYRKYGFTPEMIHFTEEHYHDARY